jgi:hypothetical protein
MVTDSVHNSKLDDSDTAQKIGSINGEIDLWYIDDWADI